jgi:hypothetical protein
MNFQLQQLFDAQRMSQWQYRKSLIMMLVAKFAMALAFGILLLGMLLTS